MKQLETISKAIKPKIKKGEGFNIADLPQLSFTNTIVILEDLDRVQYEKLRRIFSMLSVLCDKKEVLFMLV